MSLAAAAIESRLALKDVFLEGRRMGMARTWREAAQRLRAAGHRDAADAAETPHTSNRWALIEGPGSFDVVRRLAR